MAKLNCGLGLVAISYISIDYLRHVSPYWHERLQPALWVALALAAVARAPFYRYWSLEIRAAILFLASLVFMICAFLCEMISVRFVTPVLGLDYHRSAFPLPDTGHWLLLALNEKLPQMVVDILRARIVGLHHYLMLFMMLGFSVLFNSVKAPGLGLAARYMFTMGIGRLLRAMTFVSTILPSTRPWCADSRYEIPSHPHPWAQKYFMPYAFDSMAIRRVIQTDTHYATVREYPGEVRPDWGRMSFLIDIMRPGASDRSWYQLLKRGSGGCNDLMYSGHMLVAVLTAMAWTVEAKKQTFSSFDDLLENCDKPVLVDFYATWCGPCQFMVPVLEQVTGKMKDKIQVVKIDTEKYTQIADRYQIAALPTFIIFKDGKPLDRFEGAFPADQLIQRIENALKVPQ